MLGGLNFFRDNPPYRHAVINYFLSKMLNLGFKMGLQLPPHVYYETIKRDFGAQLGEQDVLVAALCTIINTQQKINAVNNQKFQQFAAQAQQRIAQLDTEVNRLKEKEKSLWQRINAQDPMQTSQVPPPIILSDNIGGHSAL